ncbi:Tn7-like element transposition protein TnsE [Natranaerobius thermophilus]
MRISKPYKKENRWYIDALFYSHKTKRVRLDIARLLRLHLGGTYKDGEFIGFESAIEMDISIPNSVIKNRKITPFLNKDKYNKEFDYYTFGIPYKDHFIVIPIIELVRAVLLPDTFWMNQVTQLDALDTSFVSSMSSEVLQVQFDPSINVSYVKLNEKINHLAWIMTNSNIFNMIAELYNNVSNGQGFLFDFGFTSLNMQVMAEQVGNKIFVKQIKSFRGKKIKTQKIEVSHPKLYKNSPSNETRDQYHKTIKISGDDKVLDASKDGSYKDQDIVDENISKSEYTNYVKITRNKIPKKSKKPIETVETAKLYKEDSNSRTTSDLGGKEVVPQLEFLNNFQFLNINDFDEINQVLDLINERGNVVSVQRLVGKLKDHWSYGSFCDLKDGKKERRYLLGKITLSNGTEAVLIEIEREDRALTTLMLVSEKTANWNKICHVVLKGLVKNSGSWSAEVINKIKTTYGIREHRFKHTRTDIHKKEKRIFSFI